MAPEFCNPLNLIGSKRMAECHKMSHLFIVMMSDCAKNFVKMIIKETKIAVVMEPVH